jgi:SAM-dependent methyltransferase
MRRAAGSTRRLARQLKWALQDRRLIAEQDRGVLGPAHLGWRDNSAGENRSRWTSWNWTSRGEEWNASDAWKRALIDDVLCRWIAPNGVVVEIGPGGGRWSEVLASRSSRLILVDVSERPLEVCRERFSGASNLEYVLSSGSDLPGVATGSVDAVWSFDVFVHVAPSDQAAYLDEIARVLRRGGVAAIHHADGRNRGVLASRHGWRAPMSRRLFAALAAKRGLRVECAIDSWGPDGRYDLSAYADAITICRRD